MPKSVAAAAVTLTTPIPAFGLAIALVLFLYGVANAALRKCEVSVSSDEAGQVDVSVQSLPPLFAEASDIYTWHPPPISTGVDLVLVYRKEGHEPLGGHARVEGSSGLTFAVSYKSGAAWTNVDEPSECGTGEQGLPACDVMLEDKTLAERALLAALGEGQPLRIIVRRGAVLFADVSFNPSHVAARDALLAKESAFCSSS